MRGTPYSAHQKFREERRDAESLEALEKVSLHEQRESSASQAPRKDLCMIDDVPHLGDELKSNAGTP